MSERRDAQRAPPSRSTDVARCLCGLFRIAHTFAAKGDPMQPRHHSFSVLLLQPRGCLSPCRFLLAALDRSKLTLVATVLEGQFRL